MITYADMVRWTQTLDMLANRIGIINQLLGCKYCHGSDSICKLVYSKGEYLVTFDGATIAAFGIYDNAGLSDASVTLNAWSDAIWHVGRIGKLDL